MSASAQHYIQHVAHVASIKSMYARHNKRGVVSVDKINKGVVAVYLVE